MNCCALGKTKDASTFEWLIERKRLDLKNIKSYFTVSWMRQLDKY